MDRKIQLAGGAMDGAIIDASGLVDIPRILSLRTADGKEYHYTFGSMLVRGNGVVCTLYASHVNTSGGVE